MVGTGTGLAPFIAMAKQLHHEAVNGRGDGRKYTILHTNRTYPELAYHQDLLEMERAENFDFVYVPTVSRPTQRDIDDDAVGIGRANNVLRHMFDLPMKEEEVLAAARAGNGDLARAEAGMKRTPKPELPSHVSVAGLRDRFDPAKDRHPDLRQPVVDGRHRGNGHTPSRQVRNGGVVGAAIHTSAAQPLDRLSNLGIVGQCGNVVVLGERDHPTRVDHEDGAFGDPILAVHAVGLRHGAVGMKIAEQVVRNAAEAAGPRHL